MDEYKNFTEEMLKDGSTLCYLKHRFLSKKTREQLDWLLACLRDSVLIVPTLPVSGKPDFLESDDGVRFLPVFSQEKQLPPDYMEEFDLRRMRIEECVGLAKEYPDCSGLVLDGFTEAMIIEYDLTDAILRIPSRLHPKEEEKGDAEA